jgi:selenide,water dikinase
VLRPLQERFTPALFPDLIVGLGQPDDAAVYRLSDDRAIVQTVDFFPPVVDDAYSFGAIAAANALSDIYAMGGDPIFALNICAFPEDLPAEIISAILSGGADKVAEAGAAIAGGHSVRDREPKYGLTVTGIMNPAYLMAKGGARPGDVLVLTKPLGVGVITTAIKRDQAAPGHIESAIASMMQLNKQAGHAARELGARAATDITGYGLIGHSLEMASQAGVCFEFDWAAIPFLPGAIGYAEQWIFAGGADTNAKAAHEQVVFDATLTDWQQMLLFDPQTSGGLLVALPAERAEQLVTRLREHAEQAWIIGRVKEGRGIRVLSSSVIS